MKIDKQFSKMQLKQLLSENVLGALPSSKLMKMKWNPVTGKSSVKEANADGTISKDEPKKRAEMLKKFDSDLKKLVSKYAAQAGKIGGPFREDGIKAEMAKIVNQYYLGL
jgi:hypothetical protein